jgi:hypothetical protein
MKIFVGYDSREDIAYQVCEYSIKKHNSDIDVVPLVQKDLRAVNLYWREADKLASTEFTFTRFLVPALMNYKGWAVFCDCDFAWTVDAKELFDLADPQYAVQVVKHEHTPSSNVKMDGCVQHLYPRKNWSSLILWNCGHPSNQQLTPDIVNKETGAFLHRFQWLKDEEIGELKPEWNWLVEWNKEPNDGKPKVLHWTEGGPWFKNYRYCEYHTIWKTYLNEMLS